MDWLIFNHFKECGKRPRFLVTFVRYKQGPFAKNAETFEKRCIGITTDWCRKYTRHYFLVREYHEDKSSHIHALVYQPDDFKPSALKSKYCRIHILPLGDEKDGEGKAADRPVEETSPDRGCICTSCIYNMSLPNEDIVGAHYPRKRKCLLQEAKFQDTIVSRTAHYMAKCYWAVKPERYVNFNCSCKTCGAIIDAPQKEIS